MIGRTRGAEGLTLAIFGALALTPDGLFIRLVATDSWTTLFWRGALWALAIFLWLAVVHFRRFSTDVLGMGLSGIAFAFSFAVGTILFIGAFAMTSVTNVLFIVSTGTLSSALMARVFLHEMVSSRTWAAIGFALVGIAIITLGSVQAGSDSKPLGDLMALGATVSSSVAFTIARRHHRRFSMVPGMALAGFATAVMVAPWSRPFDVTPQDVAILFMMGFVSVPLGFSLLTQALRYITAPEINLIMLLEAVLGPLLVWVVIGEQPSALSLVGCAVVTVTLIVFNVTALTAIGRRVAPGAEYPRGPLPPSGT